ncbi:MAG: DUF4302 domain-containing protein [Muribaculaceae bacterium]|nr:DUF4302 domain-containing protein [Muribaculaceae bacterium]
MKIHHIIPSIVIAIVAAIASGCTNNQEDFFDEPASIRMQQMLDNTKRVLIAAPNGWALDYYPDSNLSYGGYAYVITFNDTHATVGAEIKPGEFCTSLYKMTDDNGPVLSFDSYNDIMHYFAKPDSENPHAHDGDFEFIILDVKDDMIKLRGKRTGNDMYMYRLERPAAEYLNDVIDMAHDICLPDLVGTLGSTSMTGLIEPDTRYMTLSWGVNQVAEYFVPTDNGIRFLNPVTIEGQEISGLKYSHREMTYTNLTEGGPAISLKHVVGEDYILYEDIIGTYDLIYQNGAASIRVELKPVSDRTSFLMSGLNPNYDVEVTYDRSKGWPLFHSQQVGIDNDGDQRVLVWFTCKENGGKYSVNTGCGMYAKPDMANPGTYNLEPNEYTTVHANSFYIAQIESLEYVSTLDGDAAEKWRIDGKNDIDHVIALKKVQ